MHKYIFVASTAALLLGAGSVFAAVPSTDGIQLDMNTALQARAAVQAQSAHAALAAGKSGANGAILGGNKPAEIYANPYRAYPPSCLNDGLPAGQWGNDPRRLQTTITLPGDPLSGDPSERSFREVDTITLFRVVCSGGKSATLLEIDRPANHSATLYPIFPAVSVQQGSNNNYIRLASDPNTFYSTQYSFIPVVNSDIWVLENFYGSPAQFDYNQGFALTVDNLISNDPQRYTVFPMPAYNAANYAEAAQPLPITGYMSTTWYSPNQSGEGMFLQVYDNGDHATRTLAFAWFTYDSLGLPFWLYGDGVFNIGSRTATIATYYFKGGVFAPSAAKPDVPSTAWGSVSFSFPSCNSMSLVYSGNASADNGPTGSGTLTYSRIGSVNGLVCE